MKMEKIKKLTVDSQQSATAKGRWSVICRLVTLSSLLIALACSQNKKIAEQVKYTCPMHPEIIRDKPGTCPICHMDLVKVGTAGGDTSLVLNESQIKLANISTALVHRKEIMTETILNGKIAANEEETVIISSRVQGRIDRLFIKETGRPVIKGEPLYEIYSEQLLTLQQEYLLAQRQVEELEEKRYESFLKSAEKKLFLFGMTKNQIASLAKQKRTDSRVTFIAPASGIISRIDATEGQYVSEGSALYRLEKLDNLWIESELYSNEISLAKIGDRVKVLVNGFENSFVQGRIIFLSPELGRGNQIVTLRVAVENPERKFFPGMQASVILSLSGKRTIVLPLDAVIRDYGGSRVWVKEEDGSFHMRPVTTGEENSEEIEIVEGVTENENVVITGAYLLYSELVLKKGWSQHQHS